MELGQLTPTDQMDVSWHMMLCLATKFVSLGGGCGKRGRDFPRIAVAGA